jgi:hypothetical protein
VVIVVPSLLLLTTVISVIHDRTLLSRNELLQISIFRVVRNELPVEVNHVIPWGRIKTWSRGAVL